MRVRPAPQSVRDGGRQVGWWSWRAETLTLTSARLPVALPSQPARLAARLLSTQRPIGTIRPVSSASGMKSTGWIRPRSGCCQRTSASAPRDLAGARGRRWAGSEHQLVAVDRARAGRPPARGSSGIAACIAGVERRRRGRCPPSWPGTWRGRRCGSAPRRPGRRGRCATPTLARTRSACPDRRTAPAASPSIRLATTSPPRARASPSSSTANSSPPSRAAVSPARRSRRAGCATAISSSSPPAWPSESLTNLKPSRSTKSTATGVRSRAPRAARPVLQPIHEERAVRQVGERVVERLGACRRSGLGVGEREAHVLGEGEQHVALVGAVAAARGTGGDGQQAAGHAVAGTPGRSSSHRMPSAAASGRRCRCPRSRRAASLRARRPRESGGRGRGPSPSRGRRRPRGEAASDRARRAAAT